MPVCRASSRRGNFEIKRLGRSGRGERVRHVFTDARVDAKVVLIGDAAVGKTSLVVRFLHDRFDTTLPTVGASYATKQVTLPSGQPFALGIWDTAGQERFDALSSFYCRAVVYTDDDGRYSFLTNKPAPYGGRPTHIHFKVFAATSCETSVAILTGTSCAHRAWSPRTSSHSAMVTLQS